MTYIFDANLEAKTAAYYAELESYEPKERIAENSFVVVYTYDNGSNCDIEMNREELEEDYNLLQDENDFSYEGLVKYEVFNVCEEYIGEEVIRSYAEELLYSEEF